MESNSLSKKRIVNFDPNKCGIEKDHVVLFSPLDFIEEHNLYIPEKIRMPDGSINENVEFDLWAFERALELWEGGNLSMYVGRSYIQTVLNRFGECNMEHEQRIKYFHLSNVVNIFLYDNDIEVRLVNNSIVKCVRCTSKNGILYFGDDLYFVPDCNPYAESMPLTPVHGMYEDHYSSIGGIDLEGCGRDMFGGIYSLDGKYFIRWDGHDLVNSYRIRNGVKEIREKAFRRGCGSGLIIKKIYLPDTLERIGREAFMSCRLISELSLPASVVEIGDLAFHNCQSLESVKFSSNLHIIGKEAFSSTGLKSILIPNNVLHIGDKCFDNCWQLSSIKVEEGNQNYSSDDGMLYNFDKSVLLRIPPLLFPDSELNTNQRKDSVVVVEKEIVCERDGVIEYENFFENVTFITKRDALCVKEYKEIIRKDGIFLSPCIRLKDDSEWGLSEGCRVYVENGEYVESGTVIGVHFECEYTDEWQQYYGPSRKEYTIEESVKTLADGALQRSSLKKLIIPKNVECIGTDQFQYCDISEIIVSPENEYYEFRDNSLIDKKSKKLLHWFGKEKEIVIPEGVEIIGEKAFEFYDFKSLVIPEGVKCIEKKAFWCNSRGFNIYLPSSLCYIASDAFNNLDGMRYYDYGSEYNIYVPHGLSQKYVKLLKNYYASKRDIKEMESGPIDDFIEPDYKELAIVTEEDLKQAITDEFGIEYSIDGKRLLRFVTSCTNIVRVKEGTEVICEKASEDSSHGHVYLPTSVKYIGIDGIDTEKLILEGKNAYFAGQYLNEYNTIYIPSGTWGRYYNQIETNMPRSYIVQSEWQEYDDFEEYKESLGEYQLIELSKANVFIYLQQQRDILISIINSTQVLSEYSIESINGCSSKNFVCYRTTNNSFIFYKEDQSFICHFADILFILGYTLQDVCDILQVRISEIEVNEDNKETLIGRTLARRVLKSWIEDYIDEDTGEVVSIKRYEIVVDYLHTLDEDDVQKLLDGGYKKVVVHDNNPWSSYYDSYIIGVFSTSDDEVCVNAERVIGFLFPGKEFDKVTADEKKEMAYNLLIAYKDYNRDYLVPLKVKTDEQHSVVTAEENRLINLISEFYDQKINAIMDCNTDLDVMPLFTTDEETKGQLVIFLQDNNVSERMINIFVNQFFDRMLLERYICY